MAEAMTEWFMGTGKPKPETYEAVHHHSKYENNSIEKGVRGQRLPDRIYMMAVEGNDLVPKDFNGLSDPYLIIKVPGMDINMQSHVCWQTLSPKWLEKFSFILPGTEKPEVEITVWDSGFRVSEGFMGRCVIPLKLFMDHETHDQWFKLFPREGRGDTVSGAIRLKFRVVLSKTPLPMLMKNRSYRQSGYLVKAKRVQGDWWDAKEVTVTPAVRAMKWKSRFFILVDCFLFYYMSDKDEEDEPRGVIPLWGSLIEQVTVQGMRPLTLALMTHTNSSYLIGAQTKGEYKQWMKDLKQSKDAHCSSIGIDIGARHAYEPHHQREFDKKNHQFHELFDRFGINEDLIENIQCVYNDVVRFHGAISLSENYLFFYSHSFGECFMIIPFEEVVKINRAKTTFSNSISVKTLNGREFLFTSFASPEVAYQIMLATVDHFMEVQKMIKEQKGEQKDDEVNDASASVSPPKAEKDEGEASGETAASHDEPPSPGLSNGDDAESPPMPAIAQKTSFSRSSLKKTKDRNLLVAVLSDDQGRRPSKVYFPAETRASTVQFAEEDIAKLAEEYEKKHKEEGGASGFQIVEGGAVTAYTGRKKILREKSGRLDSTGSLVVPSGGDQSEDDEEGGEGGEEHTQRSVRSQQKGAKVVEAVLKPAPPSTGSPEAAQKIAASRHPSKIPFTMRCPDIDLDKFEMGHVLGRGTFGQVQLCSYMENGDLFAVKIMKKTSESGVTKIRHELEVLNNIYHPMVVKCYGLFESTDHMFILTEFLPGGELFALLRKGALKEKHAKFYASEIIICFQYFHNHNIVYRDLKPENLLVDITGHIKFIDFGFAKEIEHRSWSLCGTPEYLAPEIVTGRGHGKGVDWWALGIIIYEMIAGKSPFVNENEMQMYRNIVMVEYEMPFHFSRSVRKIISALLEKSPPHRLGCLKDGAEDIKKTSWLKKIDWPNVYQRKLKPPWIPMAQVADHDEA